MKARSRMCSSALLRHEFLKKWIKGLHICKNLNKEMNIFDRKDAIKLSADVAIASTRKATTNWSQAVLTDVVSRDENSRILVEQISGRKVEKRALITCSKRILRRNRIARQKAAKVVPQCVKPSSIAKKLGKNRTRVLKKLVPGGEDMDGISLFQETLDYIISLRVQVDVMQRLVTAAERLETSKNILICN